MPEDNKPEKRTIDTILRDLTAVVENREPLEPNTWIDAAFMLNLLLIEVEAEAIRADSKLSAKEDAICEAQEKKNVSLAKLKAKGTEEWVNLHIIQAKIKRIEELIRIAKKRSDRAAGM